MHNWDIIDKMNEIGKDMLTGNQGKWGLPLVLITCLLLVGFWEIMSSRRQWPLQPFDLTVEDFKGFSPAVAGWSFQLIPVTPSPVEPNIFAIRIVSDNVSKQLDTQTSRHPCYRTSVMVRLVHGYNMPDCMRIKGYKVELIENRNQKTEIRNQILTSGIKYPVSSDQFVPCQIWRLTSGSGDVSIWITSMLKAGDFSMVDMDVRSMPFPRIGMPDDPSWFPRGLTMSSLRHPIKNFQLFLRAKWNASRCDLLTFLRLRAFAWTSNELLTLVSVSEELSVKPDKETKVMNQVVAAHKLMQSQLILWGKAKK
jgi:hypothetical protein